MTTPADGLSPVYRFADITLDVPRRTLTITSGATSRAKRVRIEGLTLDDVLRRLPR